MSIVENKNLNPELVANVHEDLQWVDLNFSPY